MEYLGIICCSKKFLERVRKFYFLFFHFLSSIFLTEMTGPTDENERQSSAARSTSTTTPPTDTDEYIHQLMQRLTPNDEVIWRPRPGKFHFPHKLPYFMIC